MAGGFASERSWATLKGIYLLIMRLDTALDGLAVGRLGAYGFAAGYYLYVGSAFGSGGLAARLAHHERAFKARPRWHIDYLRAHAALVESWSVGTTQRRECCWAQALADSPGLSVPVRGFGASDNGCASHLLYAPRRPALHTITTALLACFADERDLHFTLEITDYTR